jgi:enamine deaminase RidA (YjgF/YER057c/UK114 family)
VERRTPLHRELGREFDVEEGQRAAKLCALNVIAQLHAALDGDLGRVVRCVRIGGFVNSMPDFGGQSQVSTARRILSSTSSETSDATLEWPLAWRRCRMTSQWKVEGLFEIR